MPSETGWWNEEEALEQHDFSYELARWIGETLPKNERLIDFGCARGQYLRYFHDVGFVNLLGLEGMVYPFNYYGDIKQQDLAIPFVENNIGNSICLEVGEHLPQEYEQIFIDNICKNTANRLILSWAVPGQGGYFHVNCKHNIWVIAEFEKRGFALNLEDTLEGRARVENRVEYFRNTLLVFDKI